MKINVNDIEGLPVANLGMEYWNDILRNVKHNANQLINNKLSDRYLKYPIEIDFYLYQNIKNDPNAYAERIFDRKYNIYIGRKLLILINNHSYEIIDKKLVFKDIKRSEENREILLNLASAIFYYWMDFICLHEWFHITRGHLEYYNKPHYEFNILSEQNEEDLFFEMDADRYAMKLVTKRFAATIKNLKTIIDIEDRVLIENFIMAMTYLFHIFFLLNGENKRGCHPSALERINTILPAIAESMHNQNTFKISEHELGELLLKKIEQFTLENGMEYNINSKKYEADTVSLFDNYFAFLREKKIEEYQILKSL
jgi:hypothetical protein